MGGRGKGAVPTCDSFAHPFTDWRSARICPLCDLAPISTWSRGRPRGHCRRGRRRRERRADDV